MLNEQNKVINKITDKSILFIALMSIPLNWIIFFALKHSEYQFPRFIPPLFGLIVIVLALTVSLIERLRNEDLGWSKLMLWNGFRRKGKLEH